MIARFFKRCFFLFCILAFTASFSQTEIKNSVLDAESFLPLESASVYILNTTIGTITNSDGKFLLVVPNKHLKDTLVISSIGFKSYKVPVDEFDSTFDVYLEPDVASLDEVVLVAETRPKTGNDIVLRALEELTETLPDSAYLQKGFLRHKERNKKEFKWLIEIAITLYDTGYDTIPNNDVKINVSIKKMKNSFFFLYSQNKKARLKYVFVMFFLLICFRKEFDEQRGDFFILLYAYVY